MVGNYKVITLCGSTRFKDAFMEMQKRLTLEGNIVISVGLFGHSGDDEVWTEGTKEMLDDMHKRKIDQCRRVYRFQHPVGNRICDSARQTSPVFGTGLSIAAKESDEQHDIGS